MKTIPQHIEYIKGQPHHIRTRVAFGAAAVGTGIITLIWLVASVGTGVFALKTTSFTDSTGGEGALTVSGNNNEQLAGVLAGQAAIAPALESTEIPARIQIIDTPSSTVSGKKIERTIIPF